MIIAIDIDDVLAESMPQILNFYNSRYSPKVSAQDLGRFTYMGFMGQTREEANKNYFDFWESAFSSQIVPAAGAVESIKKISESNEVIAVTGRPLFLKSKTEAWINQFFPNMFKGIYYNNDRQDSRDYSAYRERPKAEICDDNGAEVLIDDLPIFLDNSDHLKVLLLDQPWNTKDAPSHVKRVKNWEEITRELIG